MVDSPAALPCRVSVDTSPALIREGARDVDGEGWSGGRGR
jgi:hypothetical protein